MGDPIASFINVTASALEIAGISVIALGAIFSTVRGIRGYLGRDPENGGYVAYRRELSRAISPGIRVPGRRRHNPHGRNRTIIYKCGNSRGDCCHSYFSELYVGGGGNGEMAVVAYGST